MCCRRMQLSAVRALKQMSSERQGIRGWQPRTRRDFPSFVLSLRRPCTMRVLCRKRIFSSAVRKEPSSPLSRAVSHAATSWQMVLTCHRACASARPLVQKIGKRLDDSRVGIENTNIVVVVVFHDDIVAVRTALRNPFVSVRVSEATVDEVRSHLLVGRVLVVGKVSISPNTLSSCPYM
jgi:hypothetical protein